MNDYFTLLIGFAAMIVCHELGHYATLKLNGIKNIGVKPFQISYPYKTSKIIKKQILFVGLICGLLPLCLFHYTTFWIWVLIAAYSCLCTKDLIRLKQLGFMKDIMNIEVD